MSLLEKSVVAGELVGLQIQPDKQLLHLLFANDTGIFIQASEENFWKATSLIAIYERISSAQLNLEKSVLIQLHVGPAEEWYSHSRCQVSTRGNIFKYLGCSVGFDLGPDKILRFLMDNVCKNICH